MKKIVWFVSLVGVLTAAGCGEDPAEVSFPNDPRGVFVAESWNGERFPVFLREDTINLAGEGRQAADVYAAAVELEIGTPQYHVGIATFWVVTQTGDTIGHTPEPTALVDAGMWQYDDEDGQFLFLTQNHLGIELLEGEFADDALLLRGRHWLGARPEDLHLRLNPRE